VTDGGGRNRRGRGEKPSLELLIAGGDLPMVREDGEGGAERRL